MRKAIGAIAAAALLCALCASAFARTDFSYAGELDSFTGEPPASGAAEETRVRLSDTAYYDCSARAFAYPVNGGLAEVFSSVADGMIVTEPVRLSASGSLTLTVYRDGTALEDADFADLREIGAYSVAVREGDDTRRILAFQIVGERASLPGGYAMPEGFRILGATLDGRETDYGRDGIDMKDEGLYHVEYACPAAGLRYTLEVTVDRTPPRVTLKGNRDEGGRFRSAVAVAGIGEGDAVGMTLNGERAAFPADGRLTDGGVYTLTVVDSAGNAATERFTILARFDLNSLVLFALACMMLIGGLGYVLRKRRKLKIV